MSYTSVRIKAFRAINDFASCRKFIEGHRKVLDNHGISKITSANDEWAYNPSVFVVLVESLDGSKAYGGARVHAADGITGLPIEEATEYLDPKIHEAVKKYSAAGTGELCGLWNSIEVAGLGIGSYFSALTGVAITTQIGIDTLFALCAPPTVKFSQWVGCRIVNEIGNEGTFYYPKIDLLATVVLLEDSPNLPYANDEAKTKINSLRNNPFNTVRDRAPLRKIEIEIKYELMIEGIKPGEFKLKLH